MKNKIWSIKDIREVLEEVANIGGIPVAGIKITISKRMTRCKGMCCEIRENGKIRTTEFKFAENLINGTYPDNVVREVIIHEYAHHYIDTKTNKSNNHNKYFKAACRKFGISDETYFQYDTEETKHIVNRRQHKYEITCSCCGMKIYRKQLKCNTKDFVKYYKCGRCKGSLEIKELI